MTDSLTGQILIALGSGMNNDRIGDIRDRKTIGGQLGGHPRDDHLGGRHGQFICSESQQCIITELVGESRCLVITCTAHASVLIEILKLYILWFNRMALLSQLC